MSKVLPHFDHVTLVLANEVEDTPLQQFLLSSYYFFDSTFSGMVWIDKLHN